MSDAVSKSGLEAHGEWRAFVLFKKIKFMKVFETTFPFAESIQKIKRFFADERDRQQQVRLADRPQVRNKAKQVLSGGVSSANSPLLWYYEEDIDIEDSIVQRRGSDSTLVDRERDSNDNIAFKGEARIVQNKERINKFFGNEQVPILIGSGSTAKTSQILGIESFKLVRPRQRKYSVRFS